MKILNTIFLLLFVCVEVCAQGTNTYTDTDGYFVYEDEACTIISGVTENGRGYIKNPELGNGSITIPSRVTIVRKGTFGDLHYNGVQLKSLIMGGGNPYFEKADSQTEASALDEAGRDDGVQSNLITIDMGNGMSAENMLALLLCLESKPKSLESVEIGGNVASINWTSDSIKGVLTADVKVVVPATMVTNQVFGDAKVYGLFETAYDYSTTCVGATYIDKNDGSNMLFYVPTETQTVEGVKKARFNRVHYIIANEGLLIHHAPNTATRAELERIDNLASYKEDLTDADKVVYKRDSANYKKNMLVGSVNAQTINAKDGDYTNMILYNGSFIPTSGGTLGANKAYLKVPTSYLNGVSGAKLMMSFDNETGGETTGIHSVENVKLTIDNEDGVWYTLDGRKLIGKPTQKGVYIHDGTKVAIR